MSSAASYAATPRFEIAQISTANTNFDGTGTITTLFTAGANGSRVDSLGVQAVGNTTAGAIKIFYRKTSADTWRLIWSIAVPAVTVNVATGVLPWVWSLGSMNWIFTAGAQIGIATHNAEAFNSYIFDAGDF